MTYQKSTAFTGGGALGLPGLLFVLLLISGCGYQFRADGQPVGLDIRSLAIPMVSSPSSDLGFEADFTRIIREEFISHASIPLKPREQADWILHGNIRKVRTDPLSYNIQELKFHGHDVTHEVTARRRLRLTLDIYLMEVKTGQIIWHEPSLEGETGFMVGLDPLVNRYNQKRALEKIARDLSKKIYLQTMERF